MTTYTTIPVVVDKKITTKEYGKLSKKEQKVFIPCRFSSYRTEVEIDECDYCGTKRKIKTKIVRKNAKPVLYCNFYEQNPISGERWPVEAESSMLREMELDYTVRGEIEK